MLYPIENREELAKVEVLASLQDQVEGVRLQDNSGRQKFLENIKKSILTSYCYNKKFL